MFINFRLCVCCSFFSQDIRANFTSPVARFAVSNLHPGSVYIISIYAFNSKGRSDPAVLPAAMLRPAEKQLTAEKGKRMRQKQWTIYNFIAANSGCASNSVRMKYEE